MSSINDLPLAKEEKNCWTEKEPLGLNIVIKEDKYITVKGEDEAFRIKKEEEEAISITLKDEEEDVTVKEEKEHFGVKERIEAVEEEAVEAFRMKKEKEDAFALKEEEKYFDVEEETASIKEKDEDMLGVKETEDLNNTSERPDSEEPEQETSKKERPHQSSQCGKSFTQLGHLKKHERTHTQDNYYNCFKCGKRFSRLGQLKVDERTHTGEKPYHCFQSEKRFTQLGNLKRHETTHTGEKTFQCILEPVVSVVRQKRKVYKQAHQRERDKVQRHSGEGKKPNTGYRHTEAVNSGLCHSDKLTPADIALNYQKVYSHPYKVKQDEFILRQMTITKTKRKRVSGADRKKARDTTIKYSLLSSDAPYRSVPVCKATFINVLAKTVCPA